jgi:UDP-N-acetylmuramate--alanine ligase
MRQRVYIVGIGGIGTSSLAVILSEAGSIISGLEPSRTTLASETLARHPGIVIYDRFSPDQLDGIDWVVHTTAVKADHPALVEARGRGIPVSSYPQALGQFLARTEVCGVAGTHGKTTTTAMIAACLERAGLPVSYLVGAPLQGGSPNARLVDGSPFILEADEYRAAFLEYAHRFSTLVITNVDFDHPDYYPSQEAVEKAFGELVGHTPGAARIFGCGDSAGVRAVARGGRPIETYGVGRDCTYRVDIESSTPQGSRFRISGLQAGPVTLELGLPGRHNVLNATAAVLAANALGCDIRHATAALSDYVGARRRFDVRLDTPRLAVVDDYAHHPVAVGCFIDGLRQRYPGRRLVLVFQPHTLTRTQVLLDEFAEVLTRPEATVVLDVYAARELDSSREPQLLAARLREAVTTRGGHVLEVADPPAVVEALRAVANDGPVVVGTVGAGDVWATVTQPLVELVGRAARDQRRERSPS